MNFSSFVRKKREQKGMSLRAAAQSLGVDPAYRTHPV